MKKFVFIFVILFLSLSFISAAEIEVNGKILKGETLVAKISGNFVQPLTGENIYFYRRHMPTSMGFYDLIKIQEEYYLYVNIPLEKIPDNYSIIVKDAKYMIGTQIVTDNFFGNFTIPNLEVPFTLNPGILIADTNYSIVIQNLEPSTIIVEYKQIIYGEQPIPEQGTFFDTLINLFEESSIGEEVGTNYVSLLSGQEKTVEIVPQNYLGFQEVEFNYENSSHVVLAWINEAIPEEENETEIVNETIEETPEENETEIVNETIEETTEEEKDETFWDLLFGKDEENNTEEINLEEEEEEFIQEDSDLETCEEMGGETCETGFKCSIDTVYAKDAKCCLDECLKIEKSSTGKTIGWVIIIVLVLFLTWFFKKKYRSSPKPINLLKVGKK